MELICTGQSLCVLYKCSSICTFNQTKIPKKYHHIFTYISYIIVSLALIHFTQIPTSPTYYSSPSFFITFHFQSLSSSSFYFPILVLTLSFLPFTSSPCSHPPSLPITSNPFPHSSLLYILPSCENNPIQKSSQETARKVGLRNLNRQVSILESP